ncbi:cystathionine beta-synthase [Marivirga sp. S37H4]|uniref:Cystathionine beta-synthase n=1 Tax=Marivirga aurantiaca TaxID=2802615 RepID=A0A935C8G4_9BACT|nr:cystathionine beta-synthase [Marivirga aurantiaca]MBK6263683.1 cystathionine beta-synthase [Marivirga aurantiaca]
MIDSKALNYIDNVVKNVPSDWLKLTTHRLDIYKEELAKTEFLERFEKLYAQEDAETSKLSELPTAYDYIRLGHPLSSVLEWTIAKLNNLTADQVISFSSRTVPVLAVLRKNLFDKKNTQIVYKGELPAYFDLETVKTVYKYTFDLKQVEKVEDVSAFEGSTIFISQNDEIGKVALNNNIDFYLSLHSQLGSILLVNGVENEAYISAIQHVRRRETISMTPQNCYAALQLLQGQTLPKQDQAKFKADKASVLDSIKKITAADTKALLGNCGLSIQYAIMMGLVEEALQNHPGKEIKIIVPPNCYGGTNDQARRVAACIPNVEILDLPVDGDNDMVQSTDKVLDRVAKENAVPYIIAEIPTNPRVEVPDMEQLRAALSKERKTPTGEKAIDPVFILDQTFCPNIQFLSEEGILSNIRVISYVSGSKFPSGGKCTAGYVSSNQKAAKLMGNIEKHLILCDNEATDLQTEILAEQLPSMNQRIADAYKNTREFVNHIKEVLPTAKINFVSEELANAGFTPSVFSLDLPTKGNTDEERENYKRALNLKLINMMINEIPEESKYCVSYGQLKGCYWTIPATSTQGTTKEKDKDYIARVSVSPDLDLEHHKKVFLDFVKSIAP